MIGILGGTFDPIHFGHLRSALNCLQGLSLTEVRMIPLNVAVHRPQPQASAAQRMRMLQAALVNQTDLTLDSRELQRSGESFSYDTLTALRAELGTDIPLCLLLGTDAFANFLTWHRPYDILELVHLVVMTRPNDTSITNSALSALLQKHGCSEHTVLNTAPAGRILRYSQATQLAISSTQIRQLIAQGFSPRYLLPDAVLAVIEYEQLYR
ncbi:nicotinic acid mononucleotide adenylyltransferase [Chromatium weissei]|nr:nicotinic acid mononucleotide adenylyltransferase [Chromatium weissei]